MCSRTATKLSLIHIFTVELSDSARQFIVDHGYDPIYGARPLKRFLQKHVETLSAKPVSYTHLQINIGTVILSLIMTIGGAFNGKFGYQGSDEAIVQVTAMILVAVYSIYAAQTSNAKNQQGKRSSHNRAWERSESFGAVCHDRTWHRGDRDGIGR